MDPELVLESKKYKFSLLNKVLCVESIDGTIREDYDILRISYMKCVSSSEDNKLLGIMALILGFLIIMIGVYSYPQ